MQNFEESSEQYPMPSEVGASVGLAVGEADGDLDGEVVGGDEKGGGVGAGPEGLHVLLLESHVHPFLHRPLRVMLEQLWRMR